MLWAMGCHAEVSTFFPTSLCGVLVFGSALPPVRPSSFLPPSSTTHSHTHTTHSHTTYSHTQLTHTHTQLTHTQLTHTHTHTRTTYTQFTHTQLTHTHNLPTHTHTQFTHTQLTHTQLTHTHTHTHNLHTIHSHTTHSHTTHSHTHTHNLHTTHSHTTHSHTTYSHTTYPHTTHSLARSLAHSLTHTHKSPTQITHTNHPHTTHFAWQAWHLVTSTFDLRGRRGTWWHRSVTLRGRCGTWWHRPSLCVAGVALIALGWLWWRASVTLRGRRCTWWHRPSRRAWQAWRLVTSTVWQAWYLRHWAGSGTRLVPVWRRGRRLRLRGRRGTWRHPPSFCVAGVALGDIDRRAWFPFGAVVAASVCVAALALGDIDLRFAWQMWHLATWTVALPGRCGTYDTGLALVTRLVPVWRRGRRGRLRGKRGTWWHRPSFCVAGVVLMARGWLWWRAWFPFGAVVAASVCVAGVALGDIHRHSMWQVWRSVTSTFVLRGRRGTYGTGLALVTRLVPVWRRGRRLCLRGRRGTWRHPPSFCVAGVALGDIDRHSARQAWHLVTSTFVLRGRRGTYGTGLAVVTRLVPAWRRGRRLRLRGRRGTWWQRPSLCVVLTALGDIDLRFAWQAWHAHAHARTCTYLHAHTRARTHAHARAHTFATHHHTHTHTHTQSFTHNLVAHHLGHTQLFTYNCLIDRSSTTSFVYLSFPIRLELLF